MRVLFDVIDCLAYRLLFSAPPSSGIVTSNSSSNSITSSTVSSESGAEVVNEGGPLGDLIFGDTHLFADNFDDEALPRTRANLLVYLPSYKYISADPAAAVGTNAAADSEITDSGTRGVRSSQLAGGQTTECVLVFCPSKRIQPRMTEV